MLGCSLEQLDGQRWGEPEFDSYVVSTCHALRRKPIGKLTDEELRLAIGQDIGLDWLVPLALERLKEDAFRSGDMFEGALLCNLVGLPSTFWANRQKERNALKAILQAAIQDPRLSNLPEGDRETAVSLAADS